MPHQILLNGESTKILDEESISALLSRLQLAGRPVAIEVNAQLVPREQHDATRLQPGDRVEIVTLVGGG